MPRAGQADGLRLTLGRVGRTSPWDSFPTAPPQRNWRQSLSGLRSSQLTCAWPWVGAAESFSYLGGRGRKLKAVDRCGLQRWEGARLPVGSACPQVLLLLGDREGILFGSKSSDDVSRHNDTLCLKNGLSFDIWKQKLVVETPLPPPGCFLDFAFPFLSWDLEGLSVKAVIGPFAPHRTLVEKVIRSAGSSPGSP